MCNGLQLSFVSNFHDIGTSRELLEYVCTNTKWRTSSSDAFNKRAILTPSSECTTVNYMRHLSIYDADRLAFPWPSDIAKNNLFRANSHTVNAVTNLTHPPIVLMFFHRQ